MTALLAAATAVSLQFVPLEQPGRVNVIARNAPAESRLSLHLARPSNEPTPPMFARVVRQGNDLVLTPRFALVPGNRYQAVLRREGVSIVRQDYLVPQPKRKTPRVSTVYPRSEVLPANLLKFYLYFSEPMREGREVFDLIRLEDESGKPVHSPWRRQELWSDDARRLTLWIHPGRIKRGVNLRETFGPVLKPETHYTLVIDSAMRSAAGVPLGQAHRVPFRTGPEDRRRPNPKDWKMNLPSAQTRKPLRISAPESFDHALLARHQWIEDAAGERITGKIQIEKGEDAWSFQPQAAWHAGRYVLCVDEWLEDLAGNSPTRKFERNINDPEPRSGVTRIPFQIHPD